MKIAKGQMQILRLTTPKLHPKEQRSLFGDPGTEKRFGPLSLRMTGHLMLWALGQELLGNCENGGESLPDIESAARLENGIEIGRGGVWRNLTPAQYEKLKMKE